MKEKDNQALPGIDLDLDKLEAHVRSKAGDSSVWLSASETLALIAQARAAQAVPMSDEHTVIAQLPDIHAKLREAYRRGARERGQDAAEYAAAEQIMRGWDLPDAPAAAASQAAPVVAADERALFEADAKSWGMPLDGHGDHYSNIRTRNRWLGWMARATLAPVAAKPEGYRLVPVKLTPEMRAAWDRAPQNEDDDIEFAGAYQAMIDAAPPVAAQQAAAKAPAAQAGHRSPSGGFIIRDFEAPPGLTTTATSLDTATPASTPEASQQAAAVAAPSGSVDQGHVLRTLRRLIDGSQPQDISGAVMVIDNALKNGIAWSCDIAPPQGFVAYVKANYTGDVHFHDPEWHAVRLWNAAMKNVGPRLTAAAATTSEDARERVRDAIAEALGDAYDCLRVWSAWSVGTMGPDDFVQVAEQDERLDEITDAAIAAMRATQQEGGNA